MTEETFTSTHWRGDPRYPLTTAVPVSTPAAPEEGPAFPEGGLPFGYYDVHRLYDICWGRRGAGVGSLQHVQAAEALSAVFSPPRGWGSFVGTTFLPDGTYVTHHEPLED